MREKVAIVGFASSSRDLAPFDDESFDIWTLNHLWQFGYRWDEHFEIHPMSQVGKVVFRDGKEFGGTDHYNWLRELPAEGQEGYKPVWMQEHFDEVPASKAWPREDIGSFVNALEWGISPGEACRREEASIKTADPYPGYGTHDYWTSSISQMLAHAAWKGYKEIHVYGVDMLEEEEYYYQRSGLEYFVGLFRAAGIRVYFPPQSAICKAGFVYGYTEEGKDLPHVKPLLELFERVRSLEDAHKQQAQANVYALEGAIQIVDEIARELPGDVEAVKALLAKKREILALNKHKTQHAVSRLDGAQQVYGNVLAWTGHFGRGGTLPQGLPTSDLLADVNSKPADTNTTSSSGEEK